MGKRVPFVVKQLFQGLCYNFPGIYYKGFSLKEMKPFRVNSRSIKKYLEAHRPGFSQYGWC